MFLSWRIWRIWKTKLLLYVYIYLYIYLLYSGNNHYYPDDLRENENDYTSTVDGIKKDEELSEYFEQPEVFKEVEKLETINEVDSNIETINNNNNNNQEKEFKIKVKPKRRKTDNDLKPFNPHVGHKFAPLTYEETQRKYQEVFIYIYL